MPIVMRNSTGSKYEPQEMSRTTRMIPNAARYTESGMSGAEVSSFFTVTS